MGEGGNRDMRRDQHEGEREVIAKANKINYDKTFNIK